ncbi:hypothetical protein K493DRAFT_304324 [Basidiobolus meristosporus CBS 931.73]|uniref:Zn(2)-C6 fungal-type domain-containing protein n=1 Tax=Basidiobolus meristosporus CBS 931.73 TaxID=1314790 RepID=A0A1Y1XZH0_9FUNG|nr:hypothetical protein K493DRAFT_304324 [Basidiobolus meristosporus CBS 931.73]|eukprot:ORX91129.1 hypothetical protein K493DRAFT_304324 [Basidiobolus meristosporus CBS 931.73]
MNRLNHINPFPSPQVTDFSKLTKRKRLTQACEGCRKKKVRCDGGKPACANCARRNIECTYVPSTNKRGPRQGYIEKLEKRLDMMEKLLEPLKPNEGEGASEMEGKAEYDMQDIDSEGSGRSESPEASSSRSPPTTAAQVQVQTQSQPPNAPPQTNSSVSTSSYLATVINDHTPSQYSREMDMEYPSRTEPVSPKLGATSPSVHPANAGYASGTILHNEHYGNSNGNEAPLQKQSVLVGVLSSSTNSNPYIPQATVSTGDNFETLVNLVTRSWVSDNRVRTFIKDEGYTPTSNNPYDAGPTRPLAYPEISERLINAYFDLVYPQYPIVNQVKFMRDLESGRQSELLLNCVYAVAARYVNPGNLDSKHTFAAGDYFANRAKSIMGQYCDDHTISNVQALFLLALHAYGSGHGSGGWLYSGMATRMAQEIGMNRVDEKATDIDVFQEFSWMEKETCRRIWWSLYALERIISIGTGRQTVIDENECEVILPSDDRAWELGSEQASAMDSHYHPDPGSSSPGGLAYLVTLTTIMGRVYQFQNRLKLSRGSPSSLHAEFAILDAALVSWNISLPTKFQFGPGDPLPPGLNGRFAVWIRLMYYAALITLHRSNIGCTDSGPTFPVSLTFANSSFDRCISSANGITEILSKIQATPEYFVHSSIPLITYISAGIHVKNMFSKDQRISTTAKQCLDINYSAMDKLKAQWAQCFRYLGILKDIESTMQRLNS